MTIEQQPSKDLKDLERIISNLSLELDNISSNAPLSNESVSQQSQQQPLPLSPLVNTSLNIPGQVKAKELKEIVPKPWFVIKTHFVNDQKKLFVNVCVSKDVPAPPKVSKEELAQTLAGIDTGFRVPMSLAPFGNNSSQAKNMFKTDKDKRGVECCVIDTCVNSSLIDLFGSAELLGFLCELVLSWVEQRTGKLLSREYTLPKMKQKGELSTHAVYVPKRAGIEEIVCKPSNVELSLKSTLENKLNSASNPSLSPKSLKEKVRPNYKLIKEPDDIPEQLILILQLPRLFNLDKSILELEYKNIKYEDNLYCFDVTLSKDELGMNVDEAVAEFDHYQKELTLTVPLLRRVL